jgi:hypothetical protein
MMKPFVFGVITGATAAWVLEDPIEAGMAGMSRAEEPRITRVSWAALPLR